MSKYLDFTKSVNSWVTTLLLILLVLVGTDFLQYFPTGLKYGTWNTDMILSIKEANESKITYVFNDSIPIEREIALVELVIWNNSRKTIEIDKRNDLLLEIIGEGLFIDCRIKETKKIDPSEIKFYYDNNRYKFSSLSMPSNSAVLLQILAVNYDPSWTKLIDLKKKIKPTEIRFHNKDVSYVWTAIYFIFILALTWRVGSNAVWNYQHFHWSDDLVELYYTAYFCCMFVGLYGYFLSIHLFPLPLGII